MDTLRIILLLSLIQKTFDIIPFILPVIIWICHDSAVVFSFCMLKDVSVIRKLYLSYGALSYFAGLQIRVALILRCYEKCDSEDALFYLGFLIPLIYGVTPAAILFIYLAHLLIDYILHDSQRALMPSKATISLTIIITVLGALCLICVPVVIQDTIMDVFTVKCSFFTIMLVFIGIIVLHKAHEDGEYMLCCVLL